MGRVTETWRVDSRENNRTSLEFGPINLCNAKSLMASVLGEYDLKYIQAQWYNQSIDKVNTALKKITCSKFIEKQYLLVTGFKKFPLKSGILKEDFTSASPDTVLQLRTTTKRAYDHLKDGFMITDHTKWLCDIFFKKIHSGEGLDPIWSGIRRDFLLETFYSYCSIWMSVEAGIKIM